MQGKLESSEIRAKTSSVSTLFGLSAHNLTVGYLKRRNSIGEGRSSQVCLSCEGTFGQVKHTQVEILNMWCVGDIDSRLPSSAHVSYAICVDEIWALSKEKK